MSLDDVLAELLVELDATADEQRVTDHEMAAVGWLTRAERSMAQERD